MFPISNDMKMKINKIQNEFDAEKIFDWDQEESFLAIPFVITLGTQNATEAGYVPNIGDDINVNPTSRGYFEQIFTGREPILAQWEAQGNTLGNRTTIITQDPNSQKYEPNVKRDFAIGRSIRIWSQLTQAGTSIGTSGGFSGQTATRNIICFTNEVFNEADEYKLYLIPDLAQEQWLYVKDVQRFYMPDKTYSHALITFDTLMDNLEISGVSQEEYVQRSSPGDAYAWPKISIDNNNIEQVELEPKYLQYQPITDVQIQFFGVVGYSQSNFRARPIFKGDDYHTVRSSRLTVPFELNTPIPDQVSSNVIPEQNFYFIPQADLTIISNYDNWKDRIGAQYDQTAKKTFEGDLLTDYKFVSNTNPISNGAYQYMMWDPTFFLKTSSNYILNVSSNGMCNAGFLPGGKNIGNTYLNFSNKNLTFKEFNISNYMYHNQHELLSIGDQQRTVWSIKDIPLIGWALDNAVIGMPWGWYNSTNNPYTVFDGVNMLFSSSLYQAYTSSVYQQQKDQGFIPLDVFGDSGNDGIGAIIGAQSTTEVFNFSITDQLSFQNKYTIDGSKVVTPATKSSIFLGQKDDDLSSYWLYDQDTSVSSKTANTLGYVIDMSTFQALGQCDYKITFYSNTNGKQSLPNPVWTGRYTSNSSYAGNTRQWTTVTKYVDMPNPGFKLPWPLAIPQPALSNDKTFNLDVKLPNQEYIPGTFTDIYIPTLNDTGTSVYMIDLETLLGIDLSGYKTINISFEQGNPTPYFYIPPTNVLFGNKNITLDLTTIPAVDISLFNNTSFQTIVKSDYINANDMSKVNYQGLDSFQINTNPSGVNPNYLIMAGIVQGEYQVSGYSFVKWVIVRDTKTNNYFFIAASSSVTVSQRNYPSGGFMRAFEGPNTTTYALIDTITVQGSSVTPGQQSKTWKLDPKFGMVLKTPAAIPTLTQSAANGTDFGLYIEANTGFPISGIDYYDISYEIDYYDANGTLIKTTNETMYVGASLPNPSGGTYGMYNGASPITNWQDRVVGTGSFTENIYFPSDLPFDANNEPAVGDYLDINDYGKDQGDIRTQTTLLMNNSKTTGKIEWNMVGTLNSNPTGGQPYGTVAYKPTTMTAYWGK